MRPGRRRHARILVLILGLMALCAAARVSYLLQKPQAQTQPPGIKHVIAATTDKPSEAPVNKDAYVSTAAAGEPKYISLPTIQAKGFVQKMGIDQNKQIAAPTNINFAGWYVNSALPGQPGLSIVDGHVDGPTSPGIFKRLELLKAGDLFTIERGNGTILQYRVNRSMSVRAQDAVSMLFSQDPAIKSQLNLITCGGAFDRSSKSYKQRIIVVSELVH